MKQCTSYTTHWLSPRFTVRRCIDPRFRFTGNNLLSVPYTDHIHFRMVCICSLTHEVLNLQSPSTGPVTQVYLRADPPATQLGLAVTVSIVSWAYQGLPLYPVILRIRTLSLLASITVVSFLYSGLSRLECQAFIFVSYGLASNPCRLG